MERIDRLAKRVPLLLLLVPYGTLPRGQQPEVPEVIAIEPKEGVTSPGTRVTVYGSNLSPDTVVYFDGLEARESRFIGPSALQAVTPYLRPGKHQLQVKSGQTVLRTEVTFTSLPSPIDSEFDRVISLAGSRQFDAALGILANIAKTNSDYQVRAYAHYQTGQLHFSQGDLWRWAGEVAQVFEPAGRRAVQTSWRYRLASDESDYLLPIDSNPDAPLTLADWTVKYDVTENPEPRFFRSLVNARQGNLAKAKDDSNFILKLEPGNASYRALAAYIAVISGDKTGIESLKGESVTDARALSLLGQAAYLSGDLTGAQLWWTREAKAYPVGAILAYWAGKKHSALGQRRVAEALLAECIAMAPDSKEGREAKELVAGSKNTTLCVPRILGRAVWATRA